MLPGLSEVSQKHLLNQMVVDYSANYSVPELNQE